MSGSSNCASANNEGKKQIMLFPQKSRFWAFGILIVSLFSIPMPAVAQEKTFTIDDLPPDLMFQEWATDSTAFIFQNPKVGVQTWFKVEMDTQQVRALSQYPLNPTLSEAEAQIFQTQDVIRISPDGNLLLYATEGPKFAAVTEGENRNFRYTLANRSMRQTVTTTLTSANEVNLGDLIQIAWSADSSNVAISTLTEAGTRSIYYIKILNRRNLNEITSATFDIEIKEKHFYTADPLMNRLLDVSADGERVLLTAQADDPDLDIYSEATALVLWNPTTPEASQVIQIDGLEFALTSAAFSPRTDQELLLWTFDLGSASGSLYLYHLITGDLHELTRISPLYNPKFSPDGEWFSYSTDSELVFLSTRDLLP